MYKIDPKEHGLNEKGRLLYYDLRQKKYFKRQLVDPNEIIEISNRVILNNILNFKFKFQVQKNEKWIDASNFFFLEKARNIKTFIVDKSNLDENEVNRMIDVFSQDVENHNYWLAIHSFKKAVNYISNTDTQKIKNARTFIELSQAKYDDMTELWKNIFVYLKFLLRRKEYFEKHNLIKFSYEELDNLFIKTNAHKDFILSEIQYLSNFETETASVFKGLYYSFIKERELATKEFKNAIKGEKKLIIDMGIGEGIFTYIDTISNNGEYKNNIIELDEIKTTSEFTILMSLDSNFLRKYGPQLFYSIISLKKYHFHFHLIGEKEEVIGVYHESKMLFESMKNYIKPVQKVITPTFSYETCPEFVHDPVTLYACARFLNAPRFMKKFDSKILIIDADYYINNDFEKYFNSLNNVDVSMAVSGGVKSMRPWGRYMAGSVYIDSNETGQKFIKELNSYIIENLGNEHSWTLDQNALTYAMEKTREKIPKLKFENAYKLPRPLIQPAIRRFIEN